MHYGTSVLAFAILALSTNIAAPEYVPVKIELPVAPPTDYQDGIATDNPAAVPLPRVKPLQIQPDPVNLFARYLAHQPQRTDLLPTPLRSLLVRVAQSCSGFQVVSTGCWRGGHSLFVARTNRVSLHCLNQAADFHVHNWGCAYNVIRQNHWQGGVSGDASLMNHIHVSWQPNGREWTGGDMCRAFAHRGGTMCIGGATRFASRPVPQYASASRHVHVARVVRQIPPPNPVPVRYAAPPMPPPAPYVRLAYRPPYPQWNGYGHYARY